MAADLKRLKPSNANALTDDIEIMIDYLYCLSFYLVLGSKGPRTAVRYYGRLRYDILYGWHAILSRLLGKIPNSNCEEQHVFQSRLDFPLSTYQMVITTAVAAVYAGDLSR